jgi:hypothetical protein
LDRYWQHHEKVGIEHGEESHYHGEEVRGDALAGLRFEWTGEESCSVKWSIIGSVEPMGSRQQDHDSTSMCPRESYNKGGKVKAVRAREKAKEGCRGPDGYWDTVVENDPTPTSPDGGGLLAH